MTRARLRFRIAAAVALAAFLLYLGGIAPTVTYTGDCGELISASYRLGIAHPSGYPLYCLLGRTFASLIPFNEPGWRYNLLSALLGALTIGIVTAAVHRLTVGPDNEEAEEDILFYAHWPAIGAGLLLAGFYEFGTQAVIAEVATLEAAMEAGVIYCAIAWHQDGDWRWAYIAALCLGLGILSHLTTIFLLPGFFCYIVLQHRARLRQPDGFRPGRLIALFSLPVLTYLLTLYLPLRARLFPEPLPPGNWWPLDWTHPADLHRWLTHVTAQQYKIHLWQPHQVTIAGHTLRLLWFVEPFATLPARLTNFLGDILKMYLWCTPLLLIGAVAAYKPSYRGSRWLGWAVLGTVLFNIGLEINYQVSDVNNFFFPAYICMAIWMGLGLQFCFRKMEACGSLLAERYRQPLWHWRLTTLAPLALLGTVVVQWVIFFGAASLHDNVFAREAALERTEAVKRLTQQTGQTPALLLMEDDALWGFWYAHFVLGQPTDGGHTLPVNTPWGPERNHIDEAGRLLGVVDELQRHGPVALSKFEAAIDQKYPYVMLTPSGNLCLASRRALPPPAESLATNEKAGTDGLISGRFQRTALAQVNGKDPLQQDVGGFSPDAINFVRQAGVASLKRNDLSAFEVHFRATAAMVRNAAMLAQDRPHHAAQAGWIEVLMARHGFIKGTPPPIQANVKDESEGIPPIRVWRQQRRLIVPQTIKPNQYFRAVVPLQIEGDAPSGAYTVWTRLVTSPTDTRTPWTWTDIVFLTIK